MKENSVRGRLNLFIAITVVLIFVAFLNYYLGNLLDKTKARKLKLLQLEHKVFETLLFEDDVLRNPAGYAELQKRYRELRQLAEQSEPEADRVVLFKRMNAFYALLRLERKREALYDKVNRILPELVSSVRYIHEHHIAYLKNMLRRNTVVPDYGTGEEFEKSPIRSASELDIVKSAVSIQAYISDISKNFYDLQRGHSPSDIRPLFADNMEKFYVAVNNFESFSLDAQDGLLVEELLVNGRAFEDWFTRLLAFEHDKQTLVSCLESDEGVIRAGFRTVRLQIRREIDKFEKNIRLFQVVSLFFILLLFFWILFHSRRLVNEFRRTVEETGNIRRDVCYQIRMKEGEFREFRIIFQALNEMARTISGQVRELEKARGLLSKRVRKRTADLVRANEQLQKEMEERLREETARRQLESKLQRARKMEAIGTLAGGVAHDLNNILAGLVGYPDLLLMDLPENSRLRKPILSIKSSGEKAAAIVQDLLTLARRGVTVSEVVSLNRIIREYLGSPEFEKIRDYHPGIRVKTRLTKDLGNLMGSPVHLSKTLMNLVSNAAEAMPEGGDIIISTENRYVDSAIRGYDEVKAGDYVTLSVADMGTGILPEDMERIFEPFFTKKAMGKSGTGLGMAVVWGTVRDHEGYIDVRSDAGKGTAFTLYFPLCRKPLADDAALQSIEDFRGNGERILIVDDMPEQREIASQMLSRLGYSVISVSDGEAAVEFIRNEQADLVILDMMMPPGMDGLETYKRISEIRPGQKGIIASGFSEKMLIKEIQCLGISTYVRKPYTLEKIAVAINHEIRKTDSPSDPCLQASGE